MQSRRPTAAELERDAAIEEAARAVVQLRSTRKELLELKHSLAQCHKDPKSDSEDLAVERKRHDQILWHVAQLADTLWASLYESSVDCEESTCAAMTPAQLKLHVLTVLRDAVPMEQHAMYEEMHELYTEIARHETQQQRTARQIRSLQQDNESLRLRLVEEQAAWAQQHLSETQALQTRLQAMEMQIERLQELNTRLESRELATSSSDLLLQNESHHQPKSTMSLLLLESVHVSEFQQDEPNPKQDISTQCDLEEPLADAQTTIQLLQAQVEMYVRYHRRRRDQAEANQSSSNAPPAVTIS